MSLNSFRTGMGRVTSTPAGKATLFTIGAVLVFSLVYSGLGNNLGGRGGPTTQASGDDVIATVGGQPITRSDYEQELTNAVQQTGGQQPPPSEQYMLDNYALQQLISTKLQLAAASKMDIQVSDEDVNKARQQEIAQSGIAQKLGLPPNATISQIDEALAKDGSASIEDRLPDDVVRNALVLNKLHDSFAPAVTPTDAQDFYKEYHTQHILINASKVSDAQAQVQAQQILAMAQKPGANFAALAGKYSEDPTTKNKGGDDGWIGEDNGFGAYGNNPVFTQAVQTLQPGGITPAPVKTPEGYYIIKLVGTKENLPKDFQKNQAQYLAQIKQQRQQTAYSNFLTSLKTQAGTSIVVKDPGLKGDQALANAGQATDPTQRMANLHLAVTSYQKALKDANASNIGGMDAALGQAYQQLAMVPQAITAYQAAVNATQDQALETTLAQLYEQNHDDKDAVAVDQKISQQAWSDPQVHQTLARDFFALKRPDLAAKETALAKQIEKQQAAAAPKAPAMPPQIAKTWNKLNHGSEKITVKAASGKPNPPAKAPAQ
jgi:parvulin-like peptidyl-prolyl isomerase